jgi:hypothetical protein
MSLTYKDLVEEFGFDMWPQSDRVAGRIGSAKPAWYFEGHLEEEIRNVENQKAMIDRGGVSPENLHRIRQQVARDEMKLDMIKDTFPSPDPAKKDRLYQLWKELGSCISKSMFSHSEMLSGRADPHQEVRRAKDPVVPISRQIARWIIYCNGNVVKSKENELRVKRDDAVRAWQIAGRILGESTWSEDLRPMEHPEGTRRGDFQRIFKGFDEEVHESIEMPQQETEVPQTTLLSGDVIEDDLVDPPEPELLKQKEPDKKVRACLECGADISNTHHAQRYCASCKEIRNGRQDTDPDAGGGSERES